MAKSRIFMAGGAILLFVAGLFATKQNKYFVGFKSACAMQGQFIIDYASPSELFTDKCALLPKVYAALATTSGSPIGSPTQLFTCVNHMVPVCFK